MVGDKRQGYAILATMAVLWGTLVAAVTALEVHHAGTALQAAGASMEGKETRFGEWASALFAVSTTGTSTGAVDSFHSSYTGLGGGLLMFNMGLGEVAPGGVGSGLYGMLVLAIMTVFVAGLMVGRTPEYLRKKITAREIKLVSPLLPHDAAHRADRHRHRHVLRDAARLDAQRRAARAVRGALRVHVRRQQQRLGLCRAECEHAVLQHRTRPGHAARSLPADPVRPRHWPARWPPSNRYPQTGGHSATHRPLFVGMLTGVAVIVAGLTFFPVLALGPLAEGL